MRTFIAIDLPKKVKVEIERLSSLLYLKNVKVKFVAEPHLTLGFLDEQSEDNISKIITALKEIKFGIFNLTLNKLGSFPNLRNARVIWVDVVQNEIVKELNRFIYEKLEFLGLSQIKEYHPHITIARVKYIQDKKQFKQMVRSCKVKPIEFKVDNFVLYKSTLTSTGPIYEVLEKFKLKD